MKYCQKLKNDIFATIRLLDLPKKHKNQIAKNNDKMISISKKKLETWDDFVGLTIALRLPMFDISNGKKETMKIKRICDNANHTQPFEALKAMLTKAQIRFWVMDNSIFDNEISIHIVFPITKQIPYALTHVTEVPPVTVQVPQVNRNELLQMAREGSLCSFSGPKCLEITKDWHNLDQAIPFYNIETYLWAKEIPFQILNSGNLAGESQISTILICNKHLVD